MAGETDLQLLLAGMRPELSETMYGFRCLPSAEDIPAGAAVLSTFLEDEGLSIVAPVEHLTTEEGAGTWAKISLKVHSSLWAVGLTARVASALAEHGISANVIAAYHHDHIFVPWEQRLQALQVLREVAQQAAR